MPKKGSGDLRWAKYDIEAKRLYIDEQLTLKEVAARLNIPYSIIWRRLKKLGVIRTSREIRILKLRRDGMPWGRKKTGKDGYILRYMPEHPRAAKDGYVREHLLVWEEDHGRPLPKDWIIHHINDRKDDNRSENLLGMPKKCHRYNLMLKTAVSRIRKLETEIKKLKSQGRRLI